MLAYWKQYEKVEKEHRKRAEKEAMEQRKMDDELREVKYDLLIAYKDSKAITILFDYTPLYYYNLTQCAIYKYISNYPKKLWDDSHYILVS